MKRNIKIFLRTTAIGTVIMLCIIFGSLAVCEIYENIRHIGFGEYTKAVEITEENIRILDFIINR